MMSTSMPVVISLRRLRSMSFDATRSASSLSLHTCTSRTQSLSDVVLDPQVLRSLRVWLLRAKSGSSIFREIGSWTFVS